MSEREASPNYRNHNPTGKNQHKDCPPADDATVVRLLHEYHRKGIINKEKLSEIFKTVHGINISATTINRRKRKLGLYASAVTTRDTPDDVKLQLVLDAMAQDPERKMGARRIREAIFARTGTMLTRDYVTEMVQIHDPPRWKPKRKRVITDQASTDDQDVGDWPQTWDGVGPSDFANDIQTLAQESSAPVAGPSSETSARGRRPMGATSGTKRTRRRKGPLIDPMVTTVLRKSQEKLQVYYATQNPFPTNEERDAAIAQHYTSVLAECGKEDSWYKLSDSDTETLRREDRNLRTRIHLAVCQLLPAEYGLATGPNAMQQHQNSTRAAFLLENSRFVYEVPERGEGRFQHPLITQVVHHVWFDPTHSIGGAYPEYFNPIRNETLSLVITAIRHALLMWQTGNMVEVAFPIDEGNIYEGFLESLLQFDRGFVAPLWKRYRTSVYKKGFCIAEIGSGTIQESSLIRTLSAEEVQREHARLLLQLEQGGA